MKKSMKHESFCLISFSRIQGQVTDLFGSELPYHESYVKLRVVPGEVLFDGLGTKRYAGSPYKHIEIDLSANQFAELITTMNMGVGVPCTLRTLSGKKMESPPEVTKVQTAIQRRFEEQVELLTTNLEAYRKQLIEVLESKHINAKQKDSLRSGIDSIARDLEHNLPFYLEIFQEETEKMVSSAKTEIDAFITASALVRGLTLIQQESTPLLPEATNDSGETE